MSAFAQFGRLGGYVTSSYKSIFHARSHWINQIQISNYTKKSAESTLGIEKPKRPLTPFFKFMIQMRPALLAKNPGISTKEAIVWSSQHWKQLDAETKAQLKKEYEKDLEDYKKIKAIYEDSLTEEQKGDIQRVKEVMSAAKEKRKLKAELKELGKPKKPMSSYLLFSQSKKELLKGSSIGEFQKHTKTLWDKLSDSEKAKYDKEAKQLFKNYYEELKAWERKMISNGREDLVRVGAYREKKPNDKQIKA